MTDRAAKNSANRRLCILACIESRCKVTICWEQRQAEQHHSWSIPMVVYRAWDKNDARRRSPECTSLEQAINHVAGGQEYELIECNEHCPSRGGCFHVDDQV